MESGLYHISVYKTDEDEFFMQYIDDLFQQGAVNSAGGTAGVMRVNVNGSQMSMHVTLSEDQSGYVNSFTNDGGDTQLHLGTEEQFFNFTEEGDYCEMWTSVSGAGGTYEGYFSAWSDEDSFTIYLDEKGESTPSETTKQRWKFTAITVDDTVLDPLQHAHGD